MGKHRGRHRIPREEIAGAAVREVRPGYWMVDFQRAGRRVRKCFATLAEAKTWAGAKKIEVVNKGVETLNLSERIRSQALEAERALQGTGYTIMECVNDYLRRHPVTAGETVRQTCDRYLAAMRKEERRPVSIYDKQIKFNLLCKVMGTTPTAAVDETDIVAWAEAHGGSKKTIHDNANHARSLVRFYERGGKLKDRSNGNEKPPVTWDVATVAKVMTTAESTAPDIVVGLAVMFFAGLRPHEVLRLTWQQIDMAAGVIRLTGEQTKTRAMRHVEIAENLRAWLERYPGSGTVVPSPLRFRVQREAVVEAAKVSGWPVDVARHTFATMHYNAHQDAAKTMAQLGHFGKPETFVKHYKGVPVTPDEAAKYWEIQPAKTRADVKIVPFKVAG
jgi:integrase